MLSEYYPEFLNYYYSQNQGIFSLNYQQQFEHIISKGFGWSDYLLRHLEKYGYKTKLHIINAHPLQKKWKQEYAINSNNLIYAQIQYFKPEIIYIQNTASFSLQFIKELKEKIPSVKYMISWRSAPYTPEDIKKFSYFDLVLSSNPRIVDEFNSLNIKSEIFHYGFEKGKEIAIQSLLPNEKMKEILFAGSLIEGRDYHNQRIRLLYAIKNAGLPLEVHSRVTPIYKKVLKKTLGSSVFIMNKYIKKSKNIMPDIMHKALLWKDMTVFNQDLNKLNVKKEYYGDELLRLIQLSKSNLNIHIDNAGEYAGNARLFEVTGTGSCLITDKKKNLEYLFEPDYEVLTYDSIEDCIEKVHWVINNPLKAKEIGLRGQKKCLEQHSFMKRSEQLNDIIQRMR